MEWKHAALPLKDRRAWECNMNEKDLKVFVIPEADSAILSIWKA